MRCLFAAWLALALLLAAGRAAGQQQRQPPLPRVLVRMAGEPTEVAAQREVLAAALGGLAVELELAAVAQVVVEEVLTPDPEAPLALARVWLDARRKGEVLVYLGDGSWQRFVWRRVTSEGNAELLREQVGQIVAAAVETLLAGELVGVPREEMEEELGVRVTRPPQPTPEPPAPSLRAPRPTPPRSAPAPGRALPAPVAITPTPWRLRGALLYEGQGYASEQVLLHGPAAILSVDAPGLALAPGIELWGQYRLPFETDGAPVGFRMEGGALRLLCALQLVATQLVALHAGVGAGLDIVSIEPKLLDDVDAELSQARTRVAPLVRGRLDARLRLVGELALLVGFGADVDLIGTRYVLVDRGVEVPLVEPLRVRPLVSVGLSLTLGGAPLFAP
jgi:hypothetical protein